MHPSKEMERYPGAGPLVNEIAFQQTPSAGGKLQLYKADLAFTSAKVALPAARAIGDLLYGQDYKVKFLYKDGNDEARLELTFPLGVSCQDAEREVLAALDSDQRVVRNVNIKGHSGEVFVFAGPYARWNEINPSTSEWHLSSKNYGAAPTRTVSRKPSTAYLAN
ncbi:hypothetical protein BD413DRAFT_609662 [Trametes elegans]|nr:hypothetical protein BD413DRAFT_609662 [Trametes elegans]